MGQYTINDPDLYRLTRQPDEISGLPKPFLELDQPKSKAFMDGYISAKNPRNESNPASFSTATIRSKSLVLSLALIAQRAYGVIASITEHRYPDRNSPPEAGDYRMSWTLRVPNRNTRSFREDRYGWKKISKNQPTGRQQSVWNLSVEDDESYLADGAIVHNCQPFSKAGISKNNSLGSVVKSTWSKSPSPESGIWPSKKGSS